MTAPMDALTPTTTRTTVEATVVSQLWVVATRLVAIAVFAQAALAGQFLSGQQWARPLHRSLAVGLVITTVGMGLVALWRLHRLESGVRFAVALLGLGLGLLVQMTVGLLSADGHRLLWLHIPLGVALLGYSVDMVQRARRLNEDAYQALRTGQPTM